MLDENFLRGEVEPYIDNLYLRFPLLKRHRDSATIHLLRILEDSTRFLGVKPFAPGNQEVQFHTRLRWANEAIPWALRWVWRDCPLTDAATLDLDWTLYREAHELMDLGFKYYHLCRCFILYSRGFFNAETIKEHKRVRFFYRSAAEQRREAAYSIYSIEQDNPPLPTAVVKLRAETMPIISTVLPHYIRKMSEYSIKCDTPPDMIQYFKRWATVVMQEMKFAMPGDWNFGDYTLDHFKSFWKSLITLALAHILAHEFADDAVGTKGGALDSLVMQVSDDELAKAATLFPIPAEAWKSIFNALIYQPTRDYWDPFWQPIVRSSDGTLLISPHLIIASSPERNLITLLTHSAAGRASYNHISLQKEKEQLSELEEFFQSSRYLVRTRVPIPRVDGTTLTDIDLCVYDTKDDVLLLLHAKWLIRPDTVQEVLARDAEVQRALETGGKATARISELGVAWLSDVLDTKVDHLPQIYSLVVNRDFIPSGWVYDEHIPVVDTDFVTQFVGSQEFTGLASLYNACKGFNECLEKKHPVNLAENEIQFGEYVFRVPTIEFAK